MFKFDVVQAILFFTVMWMFNNISAELIKQRIKDVVWIVMIILVVFFVWYLGSH